LTDIDTRAARLIEAEDRTNEERAEREQAQANESRYRDALRKIKQQDRDAAAEQARKQAAAEADELAHELHDHAAKLQEFAEGLDSLIEGYADTRTRLIDANRRAGMDTSGRWGRTSTVLAPWFRSVFGGRNSLVDLPGEQAGQAGVPNRPSRTLAQRDPLAAPRTEPDDQTS